MRSPDQFMPAAEAGEDREELKEKIIACLEERIYKGVPCRRYIISQK